MGMADGDVYVVGDRFSPAAVNFREQKLRDIEFAAAVGEDPVGSNQTVALNTIPEWLEE
uniref:Uncharacterized protein n=1 Tax=Rubinisphaera brasiliensis (strain ATCC 49424 / DSM 5305 / JCM 21570 / IAM 15109 / NBRC 103401 / IFAM 1448) TaxID=756272 RepID=F0SS37_RUBBR|nr:hypothetical protein Plabr_3788 [Rubinisphaera brasiliensis DSM 5305]